MTIAVDLFIAWYLIVILFAHAAPGTLSRRVLAPFDRLIDAIGLRQYWAMFAPDPASASTHLYVLMRRQSGATLRWERDAVPAGSLSAIRNFRRRLFVLMLATVGGSSARQSFAQYLNRAYGTPSDPFSSVDFMRVVTPVPWPPDEAAAAYEELIETVDVLSVDHGLADPH